MVNTEHFSRYINVNINVHCIKLCYPEQTSKSVTDSKLLLENTIAVCNFLH